jgi:hypothetical protein
MSPNLVRWSGPVAMLGGVLGIFLARPLLPLGNILGPVRVFRQGVSFRSKVDPGLGSGTR